MRAIDADEVFKAAYDMACQSVLIPGCEDYAHGLREAANYIENSPTLDVAPVRHGMWIWHEDDFEYECSACACRFDYNHTFGMFDHGFEYAIYCSNCGAKMDAGQEDDYNGKNADE